ncbi:MAG: hypothetical protein WCJ09_28300 [Planctomycetota bacterium]
MSIEPIRFKHDIEQDKLDYQNFRLATPSSASYAVLLVALRLR